MKKSIQFILLIPMWICCIMSMVVYTYSTTASWVFLALELGFAFASIGFSLLELIRTNIRIKKYEKILIMSMFESICVKNEVIQDILKHKNKQENKEDNKDGCR